MYTTHAMQYSVWNAEAHIEDQLWEPKHQFAISRTAVSDSGRYVQHNLRPVCVCVCICVSACVYVCVCACVQFSPREILVNIQYKHSPNLCIIDTPGLISAAPGKANASLQVCTELKTHTHTHIRALPCTALVHVPRLRIAWPGKLSRMCRDICVCVCVCVCTQAASRAIEQLVRQKAEIESLILLCLEDVSDWTHATTRRLAMQVSRARAHTHTHTHTLPLEARVLPHAVQCQISTCACM